MSNTPFTDADFYGTDGGEDEDTFEPLDGVEGTEDAAPEAFDEDDGHGEVTEQPEKSYLDFSELEGKYARLKVGDEEVEVPAHELASYAMRQADYTRKTQELAAQRQELQWMHTVQEALRVNPQQALEYLNKEFGGQQAPAATEADDDDWGQYDDPSSKQLQALQAQMAPVMEYVQMQQAEQYLNQVIHGLETKYGDAFNAEEVVLEAYNRGKSDPRFNDPRMLETVFRDMDYERLRARTSAEQHVKADTANTNAARKAAAQKAAAAVGNGSSTPRGRQTAAPQAAPKTIQEAWALAKAEMGLA